MSGLAGRFFCSPDGVDRTRLLEFAGPNRNPARFVDDDVALFVASRCDATDPCSSYGEIIATNRHVLALEGYVVNLDVIVRMTAGMSRGDALLAAIDQHGPVVIDRLDGAFAAIVWDRLERVATVHAGRFGQRVLYRSAEGSGLVVASDLRLLRALRSAPYALDDATMCQSFMHGGVYGEATALRGVGKLLPGTVVTVRKGEVTDRHATGLAVLTAETTRAPLGTHLERLDAALTQALRRMARVAGHQAVMLGSGVDSSLVAGYAAGVVSRLVAVTQQMPGDADESPEAQRIASALSIPQTIVRYDPARDDLLQQVAAYVRIAEEPAYWNQLGPPLLQLLDALPDRPPAFLTGAEGDFLFNFRVPGGASVRHVVRDGLFWPVATHTARRLLNRVTRHTYIVGSDFDLLDRSFLRRHLAIDCARDAGTAPYFDPAYEHLPSQPNTQRHFLNNGWQNVRIIAQFGRNAGAEVLFPYLDDEVVRCILSLPNEMKINKVVLRILLARLLPRRVVPRKKRGYWAHTIRWHHEAGRLDSVLELLGERTTVERGVYATRPLRALLESYRRGRPRAVSHPVLWQLLVFEMFCREFVDQPVARN